MHILFQKERIHIFFLQATYFVIKHRAGFYLVDKSMIEYYRTLITVKWYHAMVSKLMTPYDQTQSFVKYICVSVLHICTVYNSIQSFTIFSLDYLSAIY